MEMSLSNTARCRPETSEGQSERTWTIGEMAREFQVSLRALRFYEDRGLLHPRRNGMARLYSGRDRLHLQMILKAKQLGFTLAEIREILARGDCEADLNLPADQIVAQIHHLERQLSCVEAALAELRRVHARATGAAA
ncbi:MAG: MerR family transcriptional regulator [Methylovirgula sp.]|jgi:DNA-binding transcriptional MerR regulator